MDRYEFIISTKKRIIELASKADPDEYKQFNICCEEAVELVKNNEVYRLREEYFNKMEVLYC